VCLSVFLCFCLCISLSIYLSISLLVYLSMLSVSGLCLWLYFVYFCQPSFCRVRLCMYLDLFCLHLFCLSASILYVSVLSISTVVASVVSVSCLCCPYYLFCLSILSVCVCVHAYVSVVSHFALELNTTCSHLMQGHVYAVCLSVCQ